MAHRENKIRFFLANTTDREAIISWLNLSNPTTGLSECVLPYSYDYSNGVSFVVSTNAGDFTFTCVGVTTFEQIRLWLVSLNLDCTWVTISDGTNNIIYCISDSIIMTQIAINDYYDMRVSIPSDDYIFYISQIESLSPFRIDWGDGNYDDYSTGIIVPSHKYATGDYNIVISPIGLFPRLKITYFLSNAMPIASISSSFMSKMYSNSSFFITYNSALQYFPNYSLTSSQSIIIKPNSPFFVPTVGFDEMPVLCESIIDKINLIYAEIFGKFGSANVLIADMWNNRLSYGGGNTVQKIITIAGVDSLNVPVVVAPTGFVLGGSDGLVQTYGHMIYVMNNQLLPDLIQPKYNWAINIM